MNTWKSKRKIQQRYDATADIYDERYAQEQKTKYQKTLENVEVKGKKVLDVGCGSGLFFNEVAYQAEIVVGIDLSKKLLEKANKIVKNFSNTSLIQADADHLPFRNNIFGIIFAFTVLQNIPRPNETLNELNRNMECRGKVILTGLKKAFRIDQFLVIIERSGLNAIVFIDEEKINCYIAVLST